MTAERSTQWYWCSACGCERHPILTAIGAMCEKCRSGRIRPVTK